METFPKKFFKDGHYSSYVEISDTKDNRFIGRSYMGVPIRSLSNTARVTVHKVDISEKFWIIGFHTWEEFDESKFLATTLRNN